MTSAAGSPRVPPLAIVIVDRDDTVLGVNTEAQALIGFGGEAIGSCFRDLEASHLVPRLRAALEHARVAEDGHASVEATVETPDTPPRVIEITVSPLERGDRPPSALVITVLDVSATNAEHAGLQAAHEQLLVKHGVLVEEQRALRAETEETVRTVGTELQTANEELQLRLAQLEAAQQADLRKDHFLAMLAHELRNPLGPVVNALYVIGQRVGHNPEVDRVRRIAERQVRHQARLLDDLLDVSRIVLGKIELRRQSVDLADSVRNALAAAEILVQTHAHHVTAELPDGPVMMEGDPARLEQITRNLLDNAVKYTPAGGRIAVVLEQIGPEAVLRVADTGIGIAPEMLSRVFDLFIQADSSLARSRGGLGIGLTLVRRLVELHGGAVAVRSSGTGKGTEFEVRLPLAATAAVAPPAQDLPGETVLPSRRILVVEDNADARELLRVVLEIGGHRVWTAADGPAAIALAIAHSPDVAFIDIGLPRLDGYEVARRLRARLGRSIRLVALTGYGQPEDRRRAGEVGFDEYLVKPVIPEDLSRALGPG